jgi:inosine-uridine nucleoside N-ribohydrolase
MTVVDVDGVGDGEPRTDVALDLDAATFTRLLVSRVTDLDARVGA